MEELGATLSWGEPDVWFCNACRHLRANAADLYKDADRDSGLGVEYYEHASKVDDVLVTSETKKMLCAKRLDPPSN